MRIITNEKLVERRIKIGKYTGYAAFGILLAGAVASFQTQPNTPWGNYLIIGAWVSLFVALILLNISTYNRNQWGSRMDKQIATALKGLDKRFRLYNYVLPAQHVLLGPQGVNVFLLKLQDGKVTCEGDKWRENPSILRFFGLSRFSPLGNPAKELGEEIAAVQNLIRAQLDGREVPVTGYVIFNNPKVDLRLENPTVTVIQLHKDDDALKEAVRKDKPATPLAPDTLKELARIFDQAAGVTDAQATDE
jgi:hypothetical protein